MKPKNLYLILLLAGITIPMSAFVPWYAIHGFDARLFVQSLLVNRISTFFTLDLLITATGVLCFAFYERTRIRFWWVPVLLTFFVGVSAGLPLLLYLREHAKTGTLNV